MDKERTREPKRTTSTTGQVSLTRDREQRKPSSSIHFNHSHAKRHHPSVSGDGGRRGSDMDLSKVWKKEKVKASRGSSSYDESEMGSGGSDHDDNDVVRPLPAVATVANINSKKRVKLNVKVADDYVAVDPAVVPRKLRSAIHKRSSDTASPPARSAKKKHLHAYIGTNGTNKSKQSMVTDLLTKDEEDVIETLSSLASITTDMKSFNNGVDGRLLDENGDKNTTTSIIPSEATMELDCSQFLFVSTVVETLSTSGKSTDEAKRVHALTVADISEQPKIVTQSTIQTDLVSIGNTEAAIQELSSSFLKNEHPLKMNDGMGMPHPTGHLLHMLPSSRKSQLTQLELPLQLKSELGPFPVVHVSARARQEMNSLNEKRESSQQIACHEGTPDTGNMVPSVSSHGSMTQSFSIKTVTKSDMACCSARPGPSGNDLSTGKCLLGSAHKAWRKCTMHVYISHIIQNYQNAEKKNLWPLSVNQPKPHGREILDVTSDDDKRKGDSSNLSCMYTCTVDDNGLRVGKEDETSLQLDQRHSTPGIYSQLKPTRDFLSLSPICEPGDPGKMVDTSGLLPVPYLHSLPPQHRMMAFSLPPGHYPSPHPEQLAAQQLPHYIGHPFYGLHMTRMGGGSTSHQQQQKIWQAHLTNYRPPVNMKWQSGMPHDPSVITWPMTDNSSMDNRRGASHHSIPPTQQKVLPVASQITTNMKKQHQQQQTRRSHTGSFTDGSMLRPEVSAQLHMLCNAQRM